jgi:hypothetical protein
LLGWINDVMRILIRFCWDVGRWTFIGALIAYLLLLATPGGTFALVRLTMMAGAILGAIGGVISFLIRPATHRTWLEQVGKTAARRTLRLYS